MRQVTTNICLLAFASVLFLISCNQPATTSEKTDEDTAKIAANADDTAMPAYDPAMDSYEAGGKGITRIKDTLGIKMYEMTIEPGESFSLHSHPDHTFYVLQGGKVALYIQATGKQDTLVFSAGMALISGPLSDSGRNVGNTTIKGLVTDIYRPRSK